MEVILGISRLILGMSAIIVLATLFSRRRVEDRMVAVDFVSTTATGLIVLSAFREGGRVILVSGVALALISFVAMVAFARLFGGKEDDEHEHD